MPATANNTAPWRDGAPTLAALDAARDAHVAAIVDHLVAAVTRARQAIGGFDLEVDIERACMPDDDTGRVPEVVVARLGQDHWDATDALDPDTFDQHADVLGDSLDDLLTDAIDGLRDAGLDLTEATLALRPVREAARNT